MKMPQSMSLGVRHWSALLLCCLSTTGSLAQLPGQSDAGLFTSSQAERGEQAYRQHCVACHAGDLRGNSNSPALTGVGFMFLWEGRALGKLYTRMRETMPTDRPGALSQETYLDLLAFILASNGFPAGATAMSPELANSARLIGPP